MWSNLSINGNSNGVGNALYPHGLELADRKPSRRTCQPDPEQLPRLNDDGIGRDGAQGASQVPEKQAAKIRGQGGDQQQLERGRDAVRNDKRIENPQNDHEQKAHYTSQDQFNYTAGVKLVG